MTDGSTKSWASQHRGLLRVFALAVVVVAGAVLVLPTTSPLQGTTVLSAVFDDRWMLALARTAVLVAVLYLIASIFARVWQGSWLKSVGPTTTEPVKESVEEYRGQVATLRRELLDAKRTIDDLTSRVPQEPHTD